MPWQRKNTYTSSVHVGVEIRWWKERDCSRLGQTSQTRVARILGQLRKKHVAPAITGASQAYLLLRSKRTYRKKCRPSKKQLSDPAMASRDWHLASTS